MVLLRDRATLFSVRRAMTDVLGSSTRCDPLREATDPRSLQFRWLGLWSLLPWASLLAISVPRLANAGCNG